MISKGLTFRIILLITVKKTEYTANINGQGVHFSDHFFLYLEQVVVE